MEINAQQMEATPRLREQQAQPPHKQAGQGAGFETLLNQQLRTEAGAAHDPLTPGVAPGQAYNPVFLENAQDQEALDPDSAVLMEAFAQASGTLDLWDSYTQTLGSSTSTAALRDAWNLLEGIESQVGQMRGNPARAQSPELDSILNELEVLAATEKFKFNRGDYIG